jgi:hypothetical protein
MVSRRGSRPDRSSRERRLASTGLIAVVVLLASDLGSPAPSAAGGSPTELVAVDVAVDAGIHRISRTWDAAVADADGNGWPDVMVGTHADGPAALYLNSGGRFVEVLPGRFIARDRHDCDWGDANVDGLPDMYCTIGSESGTGTGPNELWIQGPNGFTNRAAAHGVTDEYGRGRRTVFIDVNHDPYPDLFVGNQYPREDSIPSPMRMFINEGGTSFRPAPEYGLDREVGGQCAQAADYDGDGWQDLLVCGQNTPTLWGLRLYRNDRGTRFVDVTSSVGIADWSSAATLADLDGDGDLDLARIDVSSAQVQMQSDGVFQPPVTVATLDRGKWLAAGDADGDGDLDLYLVQKCPPELVPNLPDVMLLNSGNGTSYVPVPIPQAPEGCGDVVTPIDYNRDGNTDFIVLNGGPYQEHGTQPRGPIQLISFMGPTNIRAGADLAFTPKSAPALRGGKVVWSVQGSETHTVTDASGMGLFDSGPVGPGGSYERSFVAAGVYPYRCDFHPDMTGSVRVPVGASPVVGLTTTSFTIRWASGPVGAGYAVDLQIKRPRASWVRWRRGQVVTEGQFVPDRGPGVYSFRARLRGASGTSGWSYPVHVTVKMTS